MTVELLDEKQHDAPAEIARFGREYDELAQLAGVPLWAQLPEAQRLAIVAASKRSQTKRDTLVDSYLTFRDVGKLLQVSSSTVSREVALHRLPVVLVRGAKRVRRSDLMAYIDGQNGAMQRNG
jgi:excisionase family DNA binding protein